MLEVRKINISKPTIEAIHELNGEFFKMNRYWDATVSVLGVTFVCQQASKLLHEHTAHWYSSQADILNENCLENFNEVAFYPETPAGIVSYRDLIDMMEQMLQKTIDFQSMFMSVIDIALENKDRLVVVELDKILLRLNEQVASIILIRDKALQYKDDYTNFDNHFPSFFPLADSSTVRCV